MRFRIDPDELGSARFRTALYRTAEAPPGEWRFTLYAAGEGVSLSRVLPVLHSLGVEVVDERPYQIETEGRSDWIYDFRLRVVSAVLRTQLDPELEADLDQPESLGAQGIAQRFTAAFEAIWYGRAEADRLNELVLRAGLPWRAGRGAPRLCEVSAAGGILLQPGQYRPCPAHQSRYGELFVQLFRPIRSGR